MVEEEFLKLLKKEIKSSKILVCNDDGFSTVTSAEEILHTIKKMKSPYYINPNSDYSAFSYVVLKMSDEFNLYKLMNKVKEKK